MWPWQLWSTSHVCSPFWCSFDCQARGRVQSVKLPGVFCLSSFSLTLGNSWFKDPVCSAGYQWHLDLKVQLVYLVVTMAVSSFTAPVTLTAVPQTKQKVALISSKLLFGACHGV